MDQKQYNLQMGIALVAALLAAVGDTLILYTPNGGYETGDFLFLQDVPQQRAIIGHFLGIIALPTYLMGVWWVTRALAPMGSKVLRMAWGASVFVLFMGCTYHAMVSLMGLLVDQGDVALVNKGRTLVDPIAVLVAGGFGLLTFGFMLLVAKGKTLLPAWAWVLSPFPVYIVFILLYLVFPLVGNVLIVAGFNLTMAIIIGLTWRLLSFESLVLSNKT